jgi:hypothetical protein
MAVSLLTVTLGALVRPPAVRLPSPAVAVGRRACYCSMSASNPPPEKLLNLLCQCAVQAQLSYYGEFKNEVRARWLESFLGHEHLKVERVGSHNMRIRYRGLSDGLRCSWRDYLTTLLRGKPEKYEVRYAVGTADPATVPIAPPTSEQPPPTPPPAPPPAVPAAPPPAPATSLAADPAAAARAAWLAKSGGPARVPPAAPPAATPSDAAPWRAASASRAANPFLKAATPTYREFTEVIEPRRIATGLISIVNQLAAEWRHDLTRHVAHEGAYIARVCEDEADDCAVDADGIASTMMSQLGDTSAAAYDVTVSLPPVVYASLRAASASWMSDMNDDGVTPFRAENFDLLQRACTREAGLSALATLEQSAQTSSTHAASALWLRELLESHAPIWEAPPRNQLGSLFLLELLTASPTPKALPPNGPYGVDGGLGLTDPPMVARMVLAGTAHTMAALSTALPSHSSHQHHITSLFSLWRAVAVADALRVRHRCSRSG